MTCLQIEGSDLQIEGPKYPRFTATLVQLVSGGVQIRAPKPQIHCYARSTGFRRGLGTPEKVLKGTNFASIPYYARARRYIVYRILTPTPQIAPILDPSRGGVSPRPRDPLTPKSLILPFKRPKMDPWILEVWSKSGPKVVQKWSILGVPTPDLGSRDPRFGPSQGS